MKLRRASSCWCYERGMRFEKLEGLGNDFVALDLATLSAGERARWLDDDGSRPWTRALCDRHRGIGADGVLLVQLPNAAGEGARMIVRNADGSRPEMCGNGLRCVALLSARHLGLEATSLVVATDAGPRACKVTGDRVSIAMGEVSDLGWLDTSERVPGVSSLVGKVRHVTVGNPHGVYFAPWKEAEFIDWGPKLARDLVGTSGVNFEWVERLPEGALVVNVWERGAGRTLACGTGACAAVFAATLEGMVPLGAEVSVRLPGGELHVRIDPDRRAFMEGPARLVFAGEIVL